MSHVVCCWRLTSLQGDSYAYMFCVYSAVEGRECVVNVALRFVEKS